MTMQNSPAGQTNMGSYFDWAKFGPAVLAEMPEATYYSSPQGLEFGRSPRQKRYFQNAYSDIYQDWAGAQGAAIRMGQEPASWEDFLQTDPWTKRYSQLPQSSRGVLGLGANPRTRFLYNF